MLTLDLIQEEDGGEALRPGVRDPPSGLSPRGSGMSGGVLCSLPAEASGKSQSLPREAAASWEAPGKHLTAALKNRCASVDLILMCPDTDLQVSPSPTATPVNRLQELIGQRLEAAERLLTEVRGKKEAGGTGGAPAEVERLFSEALAAWNQAHEVLEEVKELRELYRQLAPPPGPAKRVDQDQEFCWEPV